MYAREALAVTLDYQSVDALLRDVTLTDVVELPAGLTDQVGALRSKRAEAEQLAADVADATRRYAEKLAAAGLSIRDIAAALGVSHQRVAQLVRARVS